MNQLTLETEQPEPQNILVESMPVKEGEKFSTLSPYTQSDFMGLAWIFFEEDE